MQKYIQKNLIRSILLIFIINTLALFFHWYRLIWWFDMLMHFMGGFFCVWFVLYINNKFFNKNNDTVLNKTLIKRALLWAFVIGFGWEVFEWATDIYTGAKDMHMLDSFSDLFFDMAGACVAVLMFRIKFEGFKQEPANKLEAFDK